MRYLLAGFLALSFVSCSTIADDFDTTSIPAKQIECLALNIYHEARDQSHVGQVAVAMVTINRVQSNRFPNTLCGVVHHGYNPMRSDCHFSWFCDGKPDTPHEVKAWDNAVTMANWLAYQHDDIVDPTDGATHYHASRVTPWWSSMMKKLTTIDDHEFYLESLRYAKK